MNIFNNVLPLLVDDENVARKSEKTIKHETLLSTWHAIETITRVMFNSEIHQNWYWSNRFEQDAEGGIINVRARLVSRANSLISLALDLRPLKRRDAELSLLCLRIKLVYHQSACFSSILVISENKRRAAQLHENDVITSDESIQCGVRVVRSDAITVLIGPTMTMMTTTTAMISVLMVGSMDFFPFFTSGISSQSNVCINEYAHRSSWVKIFRFFSFLSFDSSHSNVRECVFMMVFTQRDTYGVALSREKNGRKRCKAKSITLLYQSGEKGTSRVTKEAQGWIHRIAFFHTYNLFNGSITSDSQQER